MKIYKLAIFSLVAGFATAAIANEISASSVANRKTCDEIAAEIANLSAIVDPDEETIAELTQLKQQQRSSCQRRAGARGTAAKNARRMPITTSETKPEDKEKQSLLIKHVIPLMKMDVVRAKNIPIWGNLGLIVVQKPVVIVFHQLKMPHRNQKPSLN